MYLVDNLHLFLPVLVLTSSQDNDPPLDLE